MSNTIAYKIFTTPELLKSIYAHASNKDYFSLLFTNKLGFFTAIEFIWSHVDGVIHLLKLIPGTTMLLSGANHLTDVRLPPKPSATQFSRFDLYAPLVRSLDVYSKQEPAFKTTGWQALNWRRERQPLLPALSRLVVSQTGVSTVEYTQQTMWICLLLSPSLKIIQISHALNETEISGLAASTILQGVIKTCPQLQILTLFPSNPIDVPDAKAEEQEFLLHLLEPKSVYYYFASLQNLCQLETGPLALESEGLQALGSLPRLKHLVIRFSFNRTLDSDRSIPDGHRGSHLFPALEQLTLNQPNYEEVETVLHLKPLVQNLTRFNLSMNSEILGWAAEVVVPCLGNLVCVTELVVDFDCYPSFSAMHEYDDVSDLSTLGIFATLPLQTLDLRGAVFDNAVDFAATFPNLTRLAVRNQVVSAYDLSSFATIPKLEYLAVSLHVQGSDLICFKDNIATCMSLRTLEITGSSVLPSSIFWINEEIEFLLDLWPNLQQMVMHDTGLGVDGYNQFLAYRAHLATIGGIRRARARIIEGYGAAMAESLLPKDFPSKSYKVLDPFL
ncbi:hypothetical protein BDV93DRAFT_611349 [Ceratobasidium sp. AG-I]|nr:hypothetical protein BDV93DRAFT_611349 [Ceratobasidium sp. AG-I]